MNRPANALKPSARIIERIAPIEIAASLTHRHPAQSAETPEQRTDQKRRPAETPSDVSNPGLLGNSLQRLYDSEGFTGSGHTGMGGVLHSQSQIANSSEATLNLTESLLEAVFEISEFDPLPHLSSREGEFGLGLLAGSPHEPAPVRPRAATGRPARKSDVTDVAPPTDCKSNLNASLDGLSGLDRRKVPRRESECTVSIYRCRDEERLTSERISWLLHSTKMRGQLLDVSMSGVAFHAVESLTTGSRILLRISNRTLDKQVDTSATVLRSRATSNGGWDVVCRFNKNLTFEQIHTIGRSLFAATIV